STGPAGAVSETASCYSPAQCSLAPRRRGLRKGPFREAARRLRPSNPPGMLDSFFKSRIQQPIEDFVRLAPDQRAGVIRAAVPDLNDFLDGGASIESRPAPARTLDLAKSLHAALEGIEDESPAARLG